MPDLGIRITSMVLFSGIVLFAAFFFFSLIYPRKAAAAPAPPAASQNNYGYLTPVAKPLEWTLRKLHDRVTLRTGRSAWGWAVVATTFLVNLVLFPFRILAARQAKVMRALQPQLQAINARYRAKAGSSRLQVDPEQSREISELYRRHKTHPLSGCVPALGPLALLGALYRVLAQMPELHGAGWLWITDLSRPEQLPVRILPVLLIATQWLLGKITPTASADPQMNRVMQWTPLLFGILFYSQPSALMLYWATGNLLALAQQWWLARRYA
jgi:YidC/Oxa1 family membrane protein insertase